MESLKVWFRQKSNALTYFDLSDSQAKSSAPVTCIPEKPVQQWTYTDFFFVLPLAETIIDMTTHRVIVRRVPTFFAVLLGTILSAIAYAGFSVGFGANWWAFLFAAIGAGMGFLSSFRMLVVRTWITTLQDITAIRYGASASGLNIWILLFVFVCFYAGGMLATNDNVSESLFWGFTAIAFMIPFRVIFRRTKINLTVGGRVNQDEFEFPIDAFDMEPFRVKLLENKLALDYGTELTTVLPSAPSVEPIVAKQPTDGSYQGLGGYGDL